MLKTVDTLQVLLACDRNEANRRIAMRAAIDAVIDEMRPKVKCIMIIGGYNMRDGMINHSLRIYIYDVRTNTWSVSDKRLPESYYRFNMSGTQSTVLHDGSVLITSTGLELIDAMAYRFYPSRAADYVVEIPQPDARRYACRYGSSLVTLQDGKVRRIGGKFIARVQQDNAELMIDAIYDPITHKWSATPMMTAIMDKPISASACVVLLSGEVLITGGSSESLLDSIAGITSARCYIYNPLTDIRREVASMHTRRASHAACLLTDGNVFVHGGASRFATTSTCEVYDVHNDKWSEPTVCGLHRTRHTCIPIDNKVFISGDSRPRSICNIYDLTTGEVSTVAEMPDALGEIVTIPLYE